MRHKKVGRKFGRKRGQRKAFMKGLATNLIRHESLETTEARAKELRKYIERLVTHGKKESVASLRTLLKDLPKTEAYKLQHQIAPRYKKRQGGYTRIKKHTRVRQGDAAKRATIEFV